jgi:hypothetical protein
MQIDKEPYASTLAFRSRYLTAELAKLRLAMGVR